MIFLKDKRLLLIFILSLLLIGVVSLILFAFLSLPQTTKKPSVKLTDEKVQQLAKGGVLSGKVPPGAKVMIVFAPNGLKKELLADENGVWETIIPTNLVPGEYNLTISISIQTQGQVALISRKSFPVQVVEKGNNSNRNSYFRINNVYAKEEVEEVVPEDDFSVFYDETLLEDGSSSSGIGDDNGWVPDDVPFSEDVVPDLEQRTFLDEDIPPDFIGRTQQETLGHYLELLPTESNGGTGLDAVYFSDSDAGFFGETEPESGFFPPVGTAAWIDREQFELIRQGNLLIVNGR